MRSHAPCAGLRPVAPPFAISTTVWPRLYDCSDFSGGSAGPRFTLTIQDPTSWLGPGWVARLLPADAEIAPAASTTARTITAIVAITGLFEVMFTSFPTRQRAEIEIQNSCRGRVSSPALRLDRPRDPCKVDAGTRARLPHQRLRRRLERGHESLIPRNDRRADVAHRCPRLVISSVVRRTSRATRPSVAMELPGP
jgi:hypothetical protein